MLGKEIQQKYSSKRDTGNKGVLFHIIKWALIVAIVFTSLELITKPLRASWSENYAAAGDNYLLQKKYLLSLLQYEKALLLNSKNETALNHKPLAINAKRNVLELEKLYKEKNIELQLDLITKAKSIPPEASEAAKTSRALIQKEEHQFAIVAAKNATAIDAKYRDGWLYLGIANFKTAQLVELDNDDKKFYLSNAKQALDQAKLLDPLYQPTLDYLDELKKAQTN